MLLVQPLLVVPPRGVLPRLAVVFYRVIPVTTFAARYDFGVKKYDFHIKNAPYALQGACQSCSYRVILSVENSG